MKVEKQHVLDLIEAGTRTVWHPFETTTIVAVELPNGFVVIGSSACVDPNVYDEDKGIEIAMEEIIDKVWMLEGYVAKQKGNTNER